MEAAAIKEEPLSFNEERGEALPPAVVSTSISQSEYQESHIKEEPLCYEDDPLPHPDMSSPAYLVQPLPAMTYKEEAPCDPAGMDAMMSYEKARQRLESHLQALSQPKAFICNECGRSYSKHSSLKSHQKVHSGVRPHVCPLCGKTFCYKSNLNSHVKIHQEERELSCSECGDTFLNNSNLITHQRVHARENAQSIKIREMLRQ